MYDVPKAEADLVVPAIIGEGEAVLHLPVSQHLAQLLHQHGHPLPLLACLDAALQLAVCVPPLPERQTVLRTMRV